MTPVSPLALKHALEHSEVCDLETSAGGVVINLRVKLKFYDANAVVGAADVDGCVSITASLPSGPGSFSLSRQGSGISSRLAQLSEQKLGTRALDDAFIVRCDDDGFSVLKRCETQLLAMLPAVEGARVALTAPTGTQDDDNTSDVKVTRVTTSSLFITWPLSHLDAALALWERLYAIRIGA